MISATVLVFQSSHDPSTALGMTEKERPRDRTLAGKLAMETLLVKTERRTQLADVTATFHRRRLTKRDLSFLHLSEGERTDAKAQWRLPK